MMTATKVKERSLLGIKELDASEISQLLNRTAYWDNQSEKLTPVLRAHFVANMFLRIAHGPASPSKWPRNGWAFRS